MRRTDNVIILANAQYSGKGRQSLHILMHIIMYHNYIYVVKFAIRCVVA